MVGLSLVVTDERAGLLYCNYHTVITLVAHLYTEIIRQGLLEQSGPEMDQVIKIHKDLVFAGKVPSSFPETHGPFNHLYTQHA